MIGFFTNNRHKRIMRFILTGGSAALVEYVVFLIIHHWGLHLIVANTVSFMCGLVVSFSLNRFWVFKSVANARSQFGQYLSLALVNVVISDTLIWLWVNSFSLQPFVAKLITMVMIAVWNYVIYSKYIFKPASSE